MVRDDQQKAVYAWEDQWKDWNRPTMSKQELRVLMRRAERLYGVEPAWLTFPKRNRGAHGKRLASQYDPGTHAIHLRPRHRNVAVALHETAHAIHDCLFGPWSRPNLQAHGPLWLGIYLTLLISAKIAPRAALLASAKEKGLKWAPLGKVAPGKIRRFYRGKIANAFA